MKSVSDAQVCEIGREGLDGFVESSVQVEVCGGCWDVVYWFIEIMTYK